MSVLTLVRHLRPDTGLNACVPKHHSRCAQSVAQYGTALDAANVRKMFKRVCHVAGIGDGWTPRELRTSFVSLLGHRGVGIEEIARLAGHASTGTTEVVYGRELRPVITTGAEIMGEVFGLTLESH